MKLLISQKTERFNNVHEFHLILDEIYHYDWQIAIALLNKYYK